jgi:hypothetical protein
MDEGTRIDSADLDEPLAVLAALGLTWPSGWTVARLLETIAEGGLASEAGARRFAEIRAAVSFARHGAADEALTAAGRSLAREISRRAESSPDAVAAVRATLSKAAAPGPLSPPATIAGNSVDEWREPDEPEPPEETDHLPEIPSPVDAGEPNRRRSIFAAGVALLLWTVIVLALGAWQATELRAIVWGAARSLGVRTPTDAAGVLNATRLRAIREPESRPAWQRYARIAEQRGHALEAVIALDHLLARAPNDAELLNELAWLLCTSDDRRVHDPVRCLDLARRAYALDTSPAVTDTLAEALFQNGDPAAAVTLELQALAAIGEDAPFYRRQLEKFRRAAAAQESSPEAPGSEP